MATNPIALPNPLPNIPAVTRILSRFDRLQLAAFVEVAIDLVDAMGGDPEAEEISLEDAFVSHDPKWADMVEDHEAGAYVEWTTMRGSQKRGPNFLAGHEDDEDDDQDTGVEDNPLGIDPEVDMCAAGDDRVTSGAVIHAGLISEDLGPGDADDGEREQMADDVPMLPVHSAEHNIFTDERVYLGRSNLMSSFRARTGGELSSDTGKTHRSNGWPDKPGAPI